MAQVDNMVFRDRVDAGKRLADKLSRYQSKDVVVLAIPRGGVVVGFEVAGDLGAPLSVIIPRKMGAPGNPELAIGAVTEEGDTYIDSTIVRSLGVTQSYIDEVKQQEVEEIKRRMKTYLGDRPRPELKGKIVILVDDGIATGATMKAAIRTVRRHDPAELVVAVPVAPPETAESLKELADSVVCLETPSFFYAIGQFYQEFDQVGDTEVIRLLRLANP
ncbi:MAG: phosphoribosyltransferase [Thaumarchaeota archaeon]|nr:phosphoribosyltransferase [Nitrososphaerota archaeon]MCL5318490.1 phosphoribosyltransferase [Nitrososphaerota archaeon]